MVGYQLCPALAGGFPQCRIWHEMREHLLNLLPLVHNPARCTPLFRLGRRWGSLANQAPTVEEVEDTTLG